MGLSIGAAGVVEPQHLEFTSAALPGVDHRAVAGTRDHTSAVGGDCGGVSQPATLRERGGAHEAVIEASLGLYGSTGSLFDANVLNNADETNTSQRKNFGAV